MVKILLADDDASVRSAVSGLLQSLGYEVAEAKDGAEAIVDFFAVMPDLAILDMVMPEATGAEVCQKIREAGYSTPILFLSAKGEITDKEIGFTSGGDDYLVKPFNQKELSMRIEALLRRAQRVAPAQELHRLVLGDLVLDFTAKTVEAQGSPVDVTPNELKILEVLAGNVGRVFTKDELIEAVWGAEYKDTSISIPVYIRHLREKIEKDPSRPGYLLTVGRIGYKLSDSAQE